MKPKIGLFIIAAVLLVGQHAAAQPPEPPGLLPGDEYHLMFVTDFGTLIDTNVAVPPPLPFWAGLDAADWIVTSLGSSAGHFNNWNGINLFYTAVLSTQAMPAVNRLDIQAPIYNTNGDLIATDEADLWDGAIANPVGYDEIGAAVPAGTVVWTGTTGSGTWNGISCGVWNNPGLIGTVGLATESQSWLFQFGQACNQPAHIYGLSPTLLVRGILGDYNFNGAVDAADYTVWANTFGATGSAFAADAGGDFTVDAGDYTTWANNFGETAVSPSPVPEPSTFALSALGLLGLLANGWRHRRA